MNDEIPDRLPPPSYDPTREEQRLVPEGWLEHAPVTRALLALNVAVFIVELVLSHAWQPTQAVEMRLGASYPLATLGEGRWETLLTACFLHASVPHVGFNMLVLWQAGPLVERTVGSARMAPMYLLAGAFGNVLSVAAQWIMHDGALGQFSVGASGAVSGVIMAALVLGWRVQGWRGPLTRTMASWLVFIAILGVLANHAGDTIDNAAHLGGAVAGGLIAAAWRRGFHYPASTTRAVLVSCAALLAACVGIVSVREATDRFAAMTVQDRWQYTMNAVQDGRCRDAHDGLRALERLRGPVDSVRKPVETTCGHMTDL